MGKEQLADFIERNMKSAEFTGGVTDKQIDDIQDTLNSKLSNSYKWFLNKYGSGGLFGVDILGVAKCNIASVVIETQSYRELGMSENLVVIEDIDEYAYCLNTKDMENNECPVIVWNRQGGLDDFNTAESFYEFLYQRLVNAKEAWEEDF